MGSFPHKNEFNRIYYPLEQLELIRVIYHRWKYTITHAVLGLDGKKTELYTTIARCQIFQFSIGMKGGFHAAFGLWIYIRETRRIVPHHRRVAFMMWRPCAPLWFGKPHEICIAKLKESFLFEGKRKEKNMLFKRIRLRWNRTMKFSARSVYRAVIWWSGEKKENSYFRRFPNPFLQNDP